MSAFEKWWDSSPFNMHGLCVTGIARQVWDAAIKHMESNKTIDTPPHMTAIELAKAIEKAHKDAENSTLVFKTKGEK